MRLTSAFLIFGLVAAAHAGLFVQDGQEYEYRSSITSAAGTMDVSTHTSGEMYKMKVRVQVQGKRLNVAISDIERSMYVGPHQPKEDPYQKTSFAKVDDVKVAFAIDLDDNGLFQSLTMPSGLNVFQKNLVKGWAAQLQVNSGEIKKGNMAFKSQEKSLHGDCEISYAVSDDMLVKSVSHMRDCKNRKYKFLDDWRGYRCDIDWRNPQRIESNEGLYSYANTIYKLSKDGGNYVIKAMSTTSALVSQLYETEGFSHFAHVNVTSVLVNQKSSPGDISVSGETVDTLAYEFADSSYKWNEDRDLKAREPFLSTGEVYDDDQATLKGAVMKILNNIYGDLHHHGIDMATIQKNHKMGLEALYFPMFAMDYATLKGVAEELMMDKSDKGVWMSNMFNEFLGNTGTTAAAMVIRDMVMENKFDNDRDAARVLTSVPFSIRRPNTQLVKEYEKLLDWNDAPRFVKMAIPLAFGHLVKMTCKRAGNRGSPEQLECFRTFASKYNQKFYDMFKSAGNRDDKSLALEAMQNIKYGGQAALLKDLIHGKTGDEPEYRVAAIWSAGWEAAMTEGKEYFFPVFANLKDDHEVRISALAMIFYTRPSTTDMAKILAILKMDTDYEVINMAYAIFEQFANTINPCNKEVSDRAKFFLKYMKQFSQYETDWGFGVSKSSVREYQQKKYGYGGSYNYYVVGSHKSTTPISMGMGISNSFFHTYQSNRMMVHVRIEGLAKALIKKFKTMDPATWKVDDLKNILMNEMNIRERPDQPVRARFTVNMKGANVFSRAYDESSTKEGGKLANFFEDFTSMGDEYTINHQRALQLGAALYEQPSEIGLPLAYVSSVTWSPQIKATIKRGNHRGLIYRNVEYDINVLGHGHEGMIVMNPARKVSYSIFQSRIYHMHVPRKLVIGVNPIKKELKLSISRPPYDDPQMLLAHAQTVVTVKGNKIGQEVGELKQHCSDCETRTVVSRGADAAQNRVVRDYENTEFGYYNHAEYFDCEMDIRQQNTVARAIMAFAPYNKNPKTPGALLSLGIRQVAAYVALFPRAERCGVYTRWSQSQTNPTTDIEVSLRVSTQENGSRMFFRGRKINLRMIIKANGQPEARAYRASVSIESTPGNIHNKVKIQVNRAPVAALGIKPFTLCAAYESNYPEFAKEFLAVNMGEVMTVSGKAMLQYGIGTECDQGDGEIRVNFKHQTTQSGYDDLKKKWYYKKCMEQKQSPEWKARGGNKLPATEPCYMTMWDATNARHYTWNIDFVKLTNRMKNIITNVRSIIQAGLIPYWDEDPSDSAADTNGNEIGPYMTIDWTYKNSDKTADARIETSQGSQEYKDIALRLDWSNRLRNLKMTKTIKRLIDNKIIYPCVATIGSVQTNDNVTYPYEAGTCWTLTSASCGPNPSYAVFSKKVGNRLAVRAYFGGHFVDISEFGEVSINGASKALTDGEEETFKQNDQEIFKIVKWGSTVNVYSFLRVWLATDNVFVQIMPAPSTRGQHCGLCGTFNRNMFDEWMGKDGETMMTSASAMVDEWKWKC